MSADISDSNFTPPELNEIAALLPQFEILSFIAKGGMGAVYLAKQKSLDREVAIKILPRSFGQDDSFRSSFEAEAKSMAKLNHPNLTGIYDFGQIDGMLYIVMEMVHGQSLYHASYGKTIDQAEAGRIICEICYGLDNAHQQDVLHRDIKPANILLNDQLSPKISDFGLARPVGDHESDTAFGTPGYTAPEVLHNPSAVDESTDLYSVGVMLYELLTSKLPEKPYMPATTLVGCDSRFDDIVRKAMNADPILRFRTAKSMAQAIEAILDENKSPISNSPLITPGGTSSKSENTAKAASPPVVTTQPKSSTPRNILIILILLAAIYGSWTFYQSKKITRETENAQITAENERKKDDATDEKKRQREQIQLESQKQRNGGFKKRTAANKIDGINKINKKIEDKVKTRPKKMPRTVVYAECPELDLIRDKCISLTKNIKTKADQQFIDNSKSYTLALRTYHRGLPRSKQEKFARYLNKMTDLEDENYIPSNFSKANMPDKVLKIYESRLRLQDNIESNFLKETSKLRGFYQKNLLKIKEELTEKGLKNQIPTVDLEIDASRASEQDFVDHILGGS